MNSKFITVMIVPDGTEKRTGFRMRQWLLKLIIGFIVFLIVGIILFFAFYGKVLTRAATADKLEKENERLLRYYYKVQLLEENLIQTRDIVKRLTEIAGIDIELPTIPDDSILFASLDNAKAIAPRPSATDWSIPRGMPLQGFISQDFELEDSHFHPGIDIACAENTPVLATANGIVLTTVFDSTYGNMVVIQHSDSVQTIYGHNLEILVEQGQNVLAGSRIALSGNTGKSSAPHLHYELRVNNKPIDPLEYPYDQKKP